MALYCFEIDRLPTSRGQNNMQITGSPCEGFKYRSVNAGFLWQNNCDYSEFVSQVDCLMLKCDTIDKQHGLYRTLPIALNDGNVIIGISSNNPAYNIASIVNGLNTRVHRGCRLEVDFNDFDIAAPFCNSMGSINGWTLLPASSGIPVQSVANASQLTTPQNNNNITNRIPVQVDVIITGGNMGPFIIPTMQLKAITFF